MKLIIRFTIIFLFVSLLLFGQEKSFLYKIDTPSQIQFGKKFQSSLILKLTDELIDSLNITIKTDKEIELKKVYKKNGNFKRLFFEPVIIDEHFGNAYILHLYKSDSTLIYNHSFQLVCQFAGQKENSTEISFVFPDYSYENEEVINNDFSKEEKIKNVFVNFYHPQNLAGNSVLLNSLADIEYKFNAGDCEDLMIEFWLKTNSANLPFFNCKFENSTDSILSGNINYFNLLTFNYNSDSKYYSEKFASPGNWEYFIIYFDTFDGNIKVYGNNIFIFSKPIPANWENENVIIKFFNNGDFDSKLEIDQLRFWDFKNSIDLAAANKNYSYFNADSSRLLASYNFDEENQLNLDKDNYLIHKQNIQFTKSDAPIFSKAPELDIELYNSYFSINWEAKETREAKSFIVEKSFDGHSYIEIFRTDYSADKLKYFYSDAREFNKDVVYYRVIQINNDGTEISSAVTKIGQGNIHYFNVKQNYPNPFNPITTIKIEILEQTEIELSVYDIVGKRVAILHQRTLGKGEYTFEFDGAELPSGIYFYEVKSPNSSIVQKMILAK